MGSHDGGDGAAKRLQRAGISCMIVQVQIISAAAEAGNAERNLQRHAPREVPWWSCRCSEAEGGG
jgi:hypothetical protein